jgi:hypothetical protein
VNHGNLLKSFGLPGESAFPGILVYKKAKAYRDFISESCRTVRILMKKLGVSFFVFNAEGDNVEKMNIDE